MSQATQLSATSTQPSPGRTARELVARGAVLLDVRTPDEFGAEHLPGAVNIPLQQLALRVAEIGAQERTVVVYCRSGRRSAEATSLLRQRGFRDVHDLGALHEWAR
jgi:rhodanese-related sulfurtransferase